MDRLQAYADAGIGLERGTVRLTPHHPRWKRIFSSEAYLILDELRDDSLRLYHCGSTSIPDIAAKPVIDILGSVESLERLDQQKPRLEALGYAYKGEYGIEGRRYCVLYNPEQTIGYVHLHIFQHGHHEINTHLLFRDHLRTNPDAARAYEEHKLSLVHEKLVGREKYPEEKHALIQQLLANARAERNPKSTTLALLGSAPGHKNTLQFLKDHLGTTPAEIVDLNELNIGAYKYGAATEQDDSFVPLVQKMLASDRVILATPVYWYAMSTPMKLFVDRLSDLLSGAQKHLGESLYGKKFEVVATGSDSRLPIGFEVPFAATGIYFGMDYMGALYRRYD
jgi:GrpB-like predicted nucleotidyltransferase (UPF0157 family)